MNWYTFQRSLAAVLLGNVIFFVLLTPVLPPAARHGYNRIDLGLVIDFAICSVLYILFGKLLPEKKKKRPETRQQL